MTIDEAIKHCEEVAEEQSRLYSLCPCPCDGTDNCMSLKNGKDIGCTKSAADHRQLSEWLMELKDLRAEQNDQYVFIRELMSELKEAKRLLKLTVDTNYSLHKYCYNCSHSTSDHHCDIDKYLYGTGEKECEWEWKHMGEIRNFLHD